MANVPSRSVIVTGGSAGLGRVIVLALLQDGHRVVATGQNAATLAEVVRAAREAGHGANVLGLTGDVASPADCERVVAETVASFGTVDAVVNNAGIALPTHTPADKWTFNDISIDFWRRLIDVNVNGPFFMVKAAAPHLNGKGWGRVINQITSLRSMIRAGETPYGPSKAALEAMTSAWADEYAGTGVTVNALLPGGAADTRMILASAIPDRSKLIRPEAMAAPIRWLMSPASNGFTGMRLLASEWDPSLPDDENVRRSSDEAGWKPLLKTGLGGQRAWPPQ